jgi:hypothetical protein
MAMKRREDRREIDIQRELKEKQLERERNNSFKEKGKIEYFWFSFFSGIKFKSLFSTLVHLKKHQRLGNYC